MHRTALKRSMKFYDDNQASNQWCNEGGFGGLTPPKFQSFGKAEPNLQFRGKYIRNNIIRIVFYSFSN
jgi:hypothetical protein